MGRKLITPKREFVEEPDDTDFDTSSIMSLVTPSVDEERMEAIAACAEEFSMWRPAAEVLTKVRSVPTIFPMFDRSTRVFGYPIDRVNTIHGPSNHGKTAFMLGLGLSFLTMGHIYAHVDAEMTTPGTWINRLYGRHAHNPGFLAKRPKSYEDTIDAVRQVAEKVGEWKEKGKLPEDTTALIGVDSIRKLVPKSLLAKIRKEGADGLGGRAAQLKAAMNQAWLDDLTPLLYHTGTSVLLIARESERPNATDDDRKYDKAWQVQGGKGIIYDASLVMRVTRASWVYEGSEKNKRVVGEKMRVRTWKTKVEGKDDKHAEAFFHMSNGSLVPEGFDRARDVFELGKEYGIIETRGSWFSYDGERLGQGAGNAVKLLHNNTELREAIESDCREQFRPDEEVPMGHDDDDEHMED